MASTADAIGMASTPTVEVIGTLLFARKRNRVFCRQTPALEYGVCRKADSIHLSPYVPCFLSVLRPSFVRSWGEETLSICRPFTGLAGDLTGGHSPVPSILRVSMDPATLNNPVALTWSHYPMIIDINVVIVSDKIIFQILVFKFV